MAIVIPTRWAPDELKSKMEMEERSERDRRSAYRSGGGKRAGAGKEQVGESCDFDGESDDEDDGIGMKLLSGTGKKNRQSKSSRGASRAGLLRSAGGSNPSLIPKFDASRGESFTDRVNRMGLLAPGQTQKDLEKFREEGLMEADNGSRNDGGVSKWLMCCSGDGEVETKRGTTSKKCVIL
eukprot:TRINITY_DN686_c3_g1_i1.p1 TRINITY_DN686_c3_g1~~TRINITY_DN686_c3_g1_i1.p1  ORF type:complete len:181 (-),score=53.73 TRINITY_DN686_c3_g1_i1:160-702(-)